MKPSALYIRAILAFLLVQSLHAGTTLWYNGDLTAGGGVVNEESSSTGPAKMFEDFTVTSPGGWLIDKVWSNDSMKF